MKKKQEMMMDDRKLFGLRLSAIVEIGLFFFVLFVISLLAHVHFNYFNVSPNPFWIIVILIACEYGTVEGLLAAAIASIFYLLGPVPPRTVLEDVFEHFFYVIKMPVLWFVSAVVLGELRLKHIRELNQYKVEVKQVKEEEQKIAESYNALKAIKERLEMRIATEGDTCLGALDAFRKLESSAREGIVQGALDLVKALVACDKCSIYLVENGNLQLKGQSGWEASDTYSEQIESAAPLFQAVVGKQKVISIYEEPDMIKNQGLLAVPIFVIETNETIGMIKIEQIPLLRLRTNAIETLHIIGQWVGNRLKHG